MREVVVQIDLQSGQVLDDSQLPTICSAAKAPICRKLKRRLADTVAADWVHPDVGQRGLEPVQHIICRAVLVGTWQNCIFDGGVDLHGQIANAAQQHKNVPAAFAAQPCTEGPSPLLLSTHRHLDWLL